MTNKQWNVLSASRTSLARIANKWTAMIVIVLERGPARFTELRAEVQGVSGKVLTETLRALERDGLLVRTAYDEMPPRVDYELSALGRTLIAPLRALGIWAEAHVDEVVEARRSYDERLAASAPIGLTAPS